jgi:hypothetical protein
VQFEEAEDALTLRVLFLIILHEESVALLSDLDDCKPLVSSQDKEFRNGS